MDLCFYSGSSNVSLVLSRNKSEIIPFDSNPTMTSLKVLGNDFIISSRNFIGQEGGTSILRVDQNFSLLEVENYLGVELTRKSPFVFGNKNRVIGIGDKVIGEGGHEYLSMDNQLNELARNTYDSFSGNSGISSSFFFG